MLIVAVAGSVNQPLPPEELSGILDVGRLGDVRLGTRVTKQVEDAG